MDTQLDIWCQEPLKTMDLKSINMKSYVDFYKKTLEHRCAIWLRHIPNKNWTENVTEIFAESLKSKLSILKISDGINIVDQNFFTLESKLKFLDLSGNELDHLSLPEVTSLSQPNIFAYLYALDLSKNKFTNISFVKSKFTYLKELDFSENQLTEVPLQSLHHFVDLEKLILYKNNITRFQSASEYSNVEYLDLSYNYLTNLLGCEKLANLKVLKVSYNNLPRVDSNIFRDGIWSLQELYLDHNNISEISSDAFGYFPNIKTLKLNNNRIIDLKKGIFSALKRLETLDISNNFIMNFNLDSFNSQKRLTVLNLRSNLIETLDYTNIPKVFPSLREIDILENHFQCNFFEEMISFFIEINFAVPSAEICMPSAFEVVCCKIEATTILSPSGLGEAFAMKTVKEKIDPLHLTLNSTIQNMSQFFISIEKKSDAFLKLFFYQFAFIVSVTMLIFVVYVCRNCESKKKMYSKPDEIKKMIQSV